MLRKAKATFFRLLYKAAELQGLEKQAILLGQMRAAQLQAKESLNSLADAEFSVFSQWGEDGIIEFLVNALPSLPPRFVEFGVESFREANCRFLAMNRNWSGLVIDGSLANRKSFLQSEFAWKYDVLFLCDFVTADNIQGLLAANGFASDVGILSVDIDGVDYWVLERIECRADIVIVEYNDFFGEMPVSVPYDPAFVRSQKHWSKMYWGASLSAFRHLLEHRGYDFLGTNSVGTNAFFVLSKHREAIKARLTAAVAFPCKMREAALPDGSPAYKPYRECGQAIGDLELVDVTSGKRIPVRSATAAIQSARPGAVTITSRMDGSGS
jgi:hypothetical protein